MGYSSTLLLVVCTGGILICGGIPLVPPSTTRESKAGGLMGPTTTPYDQNHFFGSSGITRRTTNVFATISHQKQIKYSILGCDIRSNSPDSLAIVPDTIGVDQEVLSCVSCIANGTQEVHALLVDEPVPVTSLHSPHDNRRNDIDIYIKTNNSLSPITLVLVSKQKVFWHIIANVKITPIKEVIVISPEGTQREFDVRWPHRTFRNTLHRPIPFRDIDADIGYLQRKDDLKKLFMALGRGSYLTSLTAIHRTHVWRLTVGVQTMCSGYKQPFTGKVSCGSQTTAIIAVAACGALGLSIAIIACVMYRCRSGRKPTDHTVMHINKEKPPPVESDYDEIEFVDKTEMQKKPLDNGFILASENFHFNPEVKISSEKMAEQEEVVTSA